MIEQQRHHDEPRLVGRKKDGGQRRAHCCALLRAGKQERNAIRAREAKSLARQPSPDVRDEQKRCDQPCDTQPVERIDPRPDTLLYRTRKRHVDRCRNHEAIDPHDLSLVPVGERDRPALQ